MFSEQTSERGEIASEKRSLLQAKIELFPSRNRSLIYRGGAGPFRRRPLPHPARAVPRRRSATPGYPPKSAEKRTPGHDTWFDMYPSRAAKPSWGTFSLSPHLTEMLASKTHVSPLVGLPHGAELR
jgi:hypothetical protein